MHISWQLILWNLARLFGAVLVAEVTHHLLYAFLRRVANRRGAYLGDRLIAHTSRSGRLLLLVLAISSVFPGPASPDWFKVPVRHILEISFIGALAWLATGLIDVLHALVRHRLPNDKPDDIRGRRILTQVQLVRQIMIGVIFFTALATALMTFPNIRSLGAGLFASAGLAGIAVGTAARPALANLVAGLQIALAEPIRIDDVVIVEGEWGQVEEVNTTYVVVRTWDLRRMIVPLSYFIEKPFQNWTHTSSDLIGVVFLYTDYTLPIEELREEYRRILQASPLWDRKVSVVQITDAKETTIEVRFLMSAANSSAAFDLRCYVREKLIDYLQKSHPQALPIVRARVAPSDVFGREGQTANNGARGEGPAARSRS
jgi:small-conductance mechanosensitive channel